MRLMLVCSSAAKLPMHIEASAQVHTKGSQRLPMGSKAVTKMRRKMAKAAAFGPAERKAEIGVGAPWKGYLEPIMDREWNDNQPIYRQLRDRVVAMILDGVLKEGDPLPSVRNVAAEYRVNHLTVLKGYQQLVDEQLVESKRGRGMFINAGARNLLLRGERQRFLAEQWPMVYATIQRLGLTAEELLNGAANRRSSKAAEEAKKP